VTRTRFIEAENAGKHNHGKFLLVGFDSADGAVESKIADAPLLRSLPVVRRLGPILTDSVWMLDLQTQEGMLFSPSWSVDALQRRFLMHPIHVCILYWPVMRNLAINAFEMWTREQLIVIPDEEVIPQPGVLIDMRGKPITKFSEWSPRLPLAARFRNRMSPQDPDGQNILTEEEINATQAEGPVW
jgi:hypothetical protein